MYLNTPPNGPLPVVRVPVVQNQLNANDLTRAISPWLQQYLNQQRAGGTGASPQLTRQGQRTIATVAATAVATTATTSGVVRTRGPGGLVSLLDQNPRRTGTSTVNIVSNVNPFAVNPQNQRRLGDLQNNPIVVPTMAAIDATNNQTRPGQRGRQRMDNRQQNTNTAVQYNMQRAQGQSGRQQANRNDNRPQVSGNRSGQNQPRQQVPGQSHRQQNRSRDPGRGRYTQHGNPPVWMD